jgi:hypothetical protein
MQGEQMENKAPGPGTKAAGAEVSNRDSFETVAKDIYLSPIQVCDMKA